MRVTPTRLVLKNFKSFVGEHVIPLPTSPGQLIYITGENKADQGLGANGCGKSTILDAIHWCLYGKTSRGLRASNVRSWGASGSTTVTIDLAIDSNPPASVTRSWRPNKLNITTDGVSTAVEQDAVDDLVGLTEPLFRNALIIGQFATTFLDLSPADKLRGLTDILDLDLWVTLSDAAAERVKAIEQSAGEIERELSTVTGRATEADQQVERFEDEVATDKKCLNRVKGRFETGSITAKAKIEESRDLVRQWEEKEAKYIATANKYKVAVDTLTSTREQYIGQLQVLRQQLGRIEGRIDALVSHAKRIGQLEGQCPTCYQSIDQKHVQQLLASADEEVDEENQRLADLKQEMGEITNTIRKAEGQVIAAKKKYELAMEDSSKIAHSRWEAQQAHEHHQRALDLLIREMKTHVENHERLCRMLEEAKARQKSLKDAMAKLSSRLTSIRRKIEPARFWIKGFKDVRLFVTKTALAEFEVATNNALGQLGLPDWEVKFDISREKKTGGISLGFTTMISSPHTDGAVPWEAWSGGEGQRLRLAGALGFASLVQTYGGVRTGLLALDEPTQHLGDEGVDDLIGLLADKARGDGITIWLIDHKTIESGSFDGTIFVTKDGTGSHITSMPDLTTQPQT